MKICFGCAWLLVGILALSGCKATPTAGSGLDTGEQRHRATDMGSGEPDFSADHIETRQRLPGGDPVDVVIYFPSWEYVAVMDPMVKDGAFLHFMRRPEAERVLSNLRVPRGTVAVICDFPRNEAQTRQEQADWMGILSGQGFKRVVFVRKEPSEPLSQARIIRDETLSQAGPASGLTIKPYSVSGTLRRGFPPLRS